MKKTKGKERKWRSKPQQGKKILFAIYIYIWQMTYILNIYVHNIEDC